MPRCFGHDYHARCIYHIILKKAPEAPYFGSLCGGISDCGIMRSPLGSIIEKQIRNLPALCTALKPLQYCIMPDHVHLLLFVTAPIPRHLGHYIGSLKVAILQEYRISQSIGNLIFEDDYYDCILHRSRSLDTLYRYIRDNPRRLAVRRAHPEFFRRVNSVRLAGGVYRAYGNFQLLDCPFKEQVVVHRADTDTERADKRDRWLYTAANGGVLVSPFISPAEKAVRDEADQAGGRFILITNRQMEDRYKPSGRDFELCEAGRMLIISIPGLSPDLTRPVCLAMNTLAEEICA